MHLLLATVFQIVPALFLKKPQSHIFNFGHLCHGQVQLADKFLNSSQCSLPWFFIGAQICKCIYSSLTLILKNLPTSSLFFPCKAASIVSSTKSMECIGRTAVFLRPRVATTGLIWVTFCPCPAPVIYDVSLHSSGYLLRASTKTSVCGEEMHILVAPEVVASIA